MSDGTAPRTPGESWSQAVETLPDASYAHLDGWKRVVERAYGNPCTLLECRRGGHLAGILPVVHLKSLLFGNNLVSMPYLDIGGPVFVDAAAFRELMEACTEKAEKLGAGVCVRSCRQSLLDWETQTDKVTMHLRLVPDPGEMLRRFSPERRNRIKKGLRHGLSVTFEGQEGLSNFYGIYAQNMRDLGSPAHSQLFFAEIMSAFPERTGLVIVRDASRAPIGAGLYFRFKGLLALPWVSSLRDTFRLNPNIVLYWELISMGCQTGAHLFDFGRSTVGSGTFEYKRQWGAEPVPLYWYHRPRPSGKAGAPMDTKGERRRALASLWKRLPLAVANYIGPRLRGGISL